MFNQLKGTDPGGVGGVGERKAVHCRVEDRWEVGGVFFHIHVIINTRQSMTNESDHYFFLTGNLGG